MSSVSSVAATTAAVEPPVDDLTARAATEYRRERDRRQPLKRDLEGERKANVRDFIYEALGPAARDLEAVFLALQNNDDTAAIYHFRRVIAGVKSAAGAFKELGAK
jgi:hypothetical protein